MRVLLSGVENIKISVGVFVSNSSPLAVALLIQISSSKSGIRIENIAENVARNWMDSPLELLSPKFNSY